ncbi:MAG: Electron transfer flavoprotein subunit beta [Promethearchaeota archaeon]|nr:MAG: Electron transfer flavoprotein subunit beta [Candidatus Lokiarchaeota archaeon]
MKIFVCIKQVPGVSEVKIDPETNTLVREGIPSIINPMDKNGIELALSIKEKHGAETIAISMGPPQAEEALREALAMGMDEAYLLTDRAFAGADTLATSHTLSLGIKKFINDFGNIEDYLIICGTQAIDGDTAQVGPELAEELDIPQITYVKDFELKDNKIIVERAFRAEEVVVIKTELPALISVLKDVNEPRYPHMKGIVDAYEKEIHFLNHEDINAKKENLGLVGSQTEVWKIFVPKRKGQHIILEGSHEETAQQLCENLKEDKII